MKKLSGGVYTASSIMEMQGTLDSPVLQIPLDGLGVCYVQAVGHELHIKAQSGLIMSGGGNPTDGMVIKFKLDKE